MYIISIFRRIRGKSNLPVSWWAATCATRDKLDAVYGLYLLEIAQIVIITNFAWSTLCVGWGNPSVLVHTSWGFAMVPVVNGASEWCATLF
jgi:hypothetical protein